MAGPSRLCRSTRPQRSLAAVHRSGTDHYSDHPDPAQPEQAVAKIAHRFPGPPDAAVSSTYAGCYDVTPDYNPVIGPTGVDRLLVAAGFSGHGFKTSPAVGELVARLVVDGGDTSFPLGRFAAGTPLTSPHPYVGAGEMR
ncbi:NAD(P)/FAD-dependent oxidoreductase [Pseudonocardia abyssalis]|uniref:NAD(P)/FAD-dependent oxidoreductase n=1 Tax=Pseudonocardia abyssalis TaxID=2792008 RepID=UPI001CF70C8D|nr:FAD-binding oxidoreductase [Pseudonocardia abyssalis]